LYTAIAQVLGEENARDVCVSPGGEDFHFYSLNTPGLAATMLGLGCDLTPGLHHPHMSFNPEALVYGAQILTTALLDAANPEHTGP
ncbi:M20/M25/M40 family metallo-hydrolase, partial [Frankia sp. Cpl3]|nr:M20/M25/M40 family metallo-hydrolase [Frankia sp. Cpl3]